MQVDQDLAGLFYRNLTLGSNGVAQEPLPTIEIDPQPEQKPEEKPEQKPIIYSISQHYNPNAHIIRQQQAQQKAQLEAQQTPEPPRAASEPSLVEQPSVETILSQNRVDPACLSPSQLQLFRRAEQPQRERLIALWRLCPPINGRNNASLAWTTSTVEQEEQMARIRHQSLDAMSLDGTLVQTADGRWVPTDHVDSEPYMVNGYLNLAQSKFDAHAGEILPLDTYSHFGTAVGRPGYSSAMDPVFQGPDQARQAQMQMELENQYGAFQQDRSQVENADAMDM